MERTGLLDEMSWEGVATGLNEVFARPLDLPFAMYDTSKGEHCNNN